MTKPAYFPLIIFAITALLSAVAWRLSDAQGYPLMPMMLALALVAFTTLASFYVTLPVLEKKFTLFMYAVLGGMMAKMFIGIVSVVAVLLLRKDWKIFYVAAYFFSYFLYTFFEVYVLMRNLRPFSEKEVR